jgi:hypothetical protein
MCKDVHAYYLSLPLGIEKRSISKETIRHVFIVGTTNQQHQSQRRHKATVARGADSIHAQKRMSEDPYK